RVFRKDGNRAFFVGDVPRAHPEHQAAMLELVLQIAGMVVAEELRKYAAQSASRPACRDRTHNYRKQRTTRGDDSADGCNRGDIEWRADQGTLCVADRFRRDIE